MLWEEFLSQVFFSSSEIKLVLILFGTKICIGNIFLQNENCNVIIFSALCFFYVCIILNTSIYVDINFVMTM